MCWDMHAHVHTRTTCVGTRTHNCTNVGVKSVPRPYFYVKCVTPTTLRAKTPDFLGNIFYTVILLLWVIPTLLYTHKQSVMFLKCFCSLFFPFTLLRLKAREHFCTPLYVHAQSPPCLAHRCTLPTFVLVCMLPTLSCQCTWSLQYNHRCTWLRIPIRVHMFTWMMIHFRTDAHAHLHNCVHKFMQTSLCQCMHTHVA